MKTICNKNLIVLLIICMASVASAGWTAVGGMNLNYQAHPAPTPPGEYEWSWSNDATDGNNGDGIALHGIHLVKIDGDLSYGLLEVDNSIDSYDAYITQTLTLPNPHTGHFGQQFLYWANPTGGATDVWVELSYNNGAEVDHFERAANGPWQTTYFWIDPDPDRIMTEITIKIGIVKDPGITTGTRTLMIEDALMWAPNLNPNTTQWDGFGFNAFEPTTMAMLAFSGVFLARRRCS